MLPLNGTSWVQRFARFDLAAVAPSEVLRRVSQNFSAAKSALSTAMSSSRPSTIMASPARSRTRLLFCSASGTKRRLASSATGVQAARAQSSSYAWGWPRCKSRRCATRSCSPCFPTLKTSRLQAGCPSREVRQRDVRSNYHVGQRVEKVARALSVGRTVTRIRI